jgi:translocation and assembly module TamB
VSDPRPEAETAREPVPAAERRRGRRLWFTLPLAILLQVLLVAFLAVLWVLGTQSGLRAALAVADEVAPGLLRVERVEGRLLGDIRIDGLALAAPDLTLEIDRLRLRWAPLAAVTGTLRVDELTASGVSVVTAPGEDEEEAGPLVLPEIVLPLRLVVDQAQVTDMRIAEAGGEPFRIERVALAAAWQGAEVTLGELALALPEPRLQARAEGSAELTGDYPLRLALSWTLALEPGAELAGEAEAAGDLERLTLEHRLTGSARSSLTAVVEDLLRAPRWSGTLTLAGVDLPRFGEGLPPVDLSGRLETAGDLEEARVVGTLAGRAPDQPGLGDLAADLDLLWRGGVLSIDSLELTETGSGALLTAGGRVDTNPPDGRVELEAAWERLRWPLTGERLAESRQGRLDAEGSFAELSYRLEGEAWGRDFPAAELSLTGTGTPASAEIGELRVDTLDGRLLARGTVAWSPAVTWDLQLTGEGLDPSRQWPGLPARVGLGVTSSGGLDGYVYRVDGGIESTAVPDAALSLSGEGDLAGTRVESLRLDTLSGGLTGAGAVGWDPALRWDAVLTAEAIDPGAQWPEWPGTLSGRVASSGRMGPAGPTFTAVIEDLAGKLRGYAVAATGRVAASDGAITVEELLLASGPSRLTAQGDLGERLDLAFELVSPDLSTLLPEARGRVTASGRASGTLATPAVRVEVDARGVQVAGQGIESLSGNADLDLAPEGLIKVDLTGRGIAAGGLAFSTLRIQGSGDPADHRLTARADGEPVAFDLEAAGGLAGEGSYAGRLVALDLRTTEFGDWRLQRPAEVELAGESLQAGPLCLRDQAGSGGCLEFAQTGPGAWQAEAHLDRVGFELARAFLPPDVTLDGAASAKASFRAAGGALSGSGSLSVPRGVLAAGADGAAVVDFSDTRLRVDADGGGLKARLDLPVAGLGAVEGDVSLPGWRLDAPARPDQPLRGRIQARADDLDLVARLVPDVTDLRGRLEADLGLSGTLAAPGISGFARLADAGLDVPMIGLTVADGRFEATARGRDRIDYEGRFLIGGSPLDIQGESRLVGGTWETSVRAAGDRLKVADSKEYKALVSPDITLAAGAQGASVSGEVRVPQASIRPRAIPAGVVTPSPDVVLAGEAEQTAAAPVAIDLRVVLGQEVSIEAFGLRGLLRGDLRVLQEPGRPEILGDGSIAVEDGTYRISGGSALVAAIGKPLTIEQGRLVFARTPIDNPGLLLTATREGGDLTAGVRVVGTLRNPKLTFFSESDPGLTQAEVTNYLITGIPPRRGGESEADRSLAVGTYVAPKLYMEYESSLGDEQDKVKLRYDLNNWIELQTETGDAQGADVFFKFER